MIAKSSILRFDDTGFNHLLKRSPSNPGRKDQSLTIGDHDPFDMSDPQHRSWKEGQKITTRDMKETVATHTSQMATWKIYHAAVFVEDLRNRLRKSDS